MYSTEPTRIKQSRKPHCCDWFGGVIQVGEGYHRWRYYAHQEASTCKLHEDCFEAMIEERDQDSYEYEFHSDHRRGCYCDGGDCDRCGRKQAWSY